MKLLNLYRQGRALIALSTLVIFIITQTSLLHVAADRNGENGVTAAALRCPIYPTCSRRGAPILQRMRYCLLSAIPVVSAWRELPFATDSAARRLAISDMEELLFSHVVGQAHVTRTILEAVRRKMASPREPLVLHFAGDNGVGKTHTARLLSLAMSLRCSPSRPLCDAGDNLLVISGTGFDGLPVADARKRIVERVTAHQRRYPHGIVLLDDLTVMHPMLVSALAPLFGRSEHFAEQPEDAPSLAQLTVIVTTDFGQQGRTWGKTLAEVEQMVRDEFTELYGTLVPAFARTMTFVSLTYRAAEQMVKSSVASLACSPLWGGREGRGSVVASSMDDLAVSFLVERHREAWEGRENGHALRRAVEDTLVPLLLRYFDANGHDRLLWAHFRLDLEQAEIFLDTGGDDSKSTSENIPKYFSSSVTSGAAENREDDGSRHEAIAQHSRDDERKDHSRTSMGDL